MRMSTVRTRISELRAELETARALEFEAIVRRRAVEARLEELENLVGRDGWLGPTLDRLIGKRAEDDGA